MGERAGAYSTVTTPKVRYYMILHSCECYAAFGGYAVRFFKYQNTAANRGGILVLPSRIELLTNP